MTLDLDRLEITVKDNEGLEYAFSKKRIVDMLKRKGLLQLLEFTDKLEFVVDGLLTITVKVRKE